MHNLTAISLALPGTPLHGLSDFDPRSRAASAPNRGGRAAKRRRRQCSGLPPVAPITSPLMYRDSSHARKTYSGASSPG